MSQVSDRPASGPGNTERFFLWVVRAGVLGVLLIPLVVTPSTIFPFVVGKALLARTIIEITFGCWLILALSCPEYRPPRSWVLLAFGLWLLVSALAAFAGVSPVRSFWSTYERMQGVVDLAHWFAYALVAASVFRSLPDWKLVFSLNLAVCSLVSILGIGQHLDLYNAPWLVWPGDTSRLESTLGNPAYLGGYAAVSSLTGIGLLAYSMANRQPSPGGTQARAARRRRQRTASLPRVSGEFWLRAFWLTAVLLALWTLWLSATRGSIVGLAAGIVVFAVGYIVWGKVPLLRWASPAFLLALIAVVVLLFAARFTTALDPLVYSSLTVERFVLLDEHEERARSVERRIESIDVGLRAYQDRPVLGWGPQNYRAAWGRHISLEGSRGNDFDQAHNKPMEELVASGILGILAYLAIWGLAAWVIIRSLRRRNPGDQLLVFLAGGAALAAYFAQNLFLFDTPTTMMLFALLIAFVAAEEEWAAAGYDRQIKGVSKGSRARALAALVQRVRLTGITRPLGFAATARGATILAPLVGPLVVAMIVFINVRAYQASQDVGRALHPSTSVEAQASGLMDSIEAFPNLANYPRIYLWTWARNNFDSMTDEQFDRTMSQMAAQERSALEAEPENWRLYAELALMYQAAAERDSRYLPVAKSHIDNVLQLAPNSRHAADLVKAQERLEEARRP